MRKIFFFHEEFGLRAQFDDPFLHLSWHEQNASETIRVQWQCYDSDGKVEENSEDTKKVRKARCLLEIR